MLPMLRNQPFRIQFWRLSMVKQKYPQKSCTFPMAFCIISSNFKSTQRAIISFIQSVSMNKDVRDASCKAAAEFSKFDVECKMRLDVFQSFKIFYDSANLDSFSPVDRRCMLFHLHVAIII